MAIDLYIYVYMSIKFRIGQLKVIDTTRANVFVHIDLILKSGHSSRNFRLFFLQSHPCMIQQIDNASKTQLKHL